MENKNNYDNDTFSLENGNWVDKLISWAIMISLVGVFIIFLLILFIPIPKIFQQIQFLLVIILTISSIYGRFKWMKRDPNSYSNNIIFKDKYSKKIED